MSGFDYGNKLPDGQHERHPTLPAGARLEFVRPVRTAYRHIGTGCGQVTRMAQAIAETYAARPTYYTSTFCRQCQDYFAVGEAGEFVWIEQDGRDGPKVGT